jgi:hypothetical protein
MAMGSLATMLAQQKEWSTHGAMDSVLVVATFGVANLLSQESDGRVMTVLVSLNESFSHAEFV